MTWFKLDDGFHNHLKTLKAGTAAVGLYCRCGSYAAQQLTDGFVPSEIAASYGTREWARRLVEAGLWEVADGGYRMPDYLDYNPSREKVLAERQAKAERQQRWREAQRRRASSTSTGALRDAAPTRPDPTPPKGGRGEGANRPEAVDNCDRCDQNGMHELPDGSLTRCFHPWSVTA